MNKRYRVELKVCADELAEKVAYELEDNEEFSNFGDSEDIAEYILQNADLEDGCFIFKVDFSMPEPSDD